MFGETEQVFFFFRKAGQRINQLLANTELKFSSTFPVPLC